jgi:hypothetical protein
LRTGLDSFFASVPVEAEQELVYRQRQGNFPAVRPPNHVKISIPVQCGSKIENRLLSALSASEFLPSLVGQISDLALDVARGPSGRRPLDRNSRSSNRVKPNYGVRFVENRKVQRGLQEKLWKNHRCISLSSFHKRGCRTTPFLERLVVRGCHGWFGLAKETRLVFSATPKERRRAN